MPSRLASNDAKTLVLFEWVEVPVVVQDLEMADDGAGRNDGVDRLAHRHATPIARSCGKLFAALMAMSVPHARRPGYETATERLPRRPLGELLRESEYATVDVRPRILPQAALRRDASLVDLEHARLQDTMQPTPLVKVEASPPIESTGNLRSRRPLYAAVGGERIAPWNAPDYLEQLAELAAAFDMPLSACAQRYGQVTLPANDRGWRFHSALGFTKRR